MKISRPNCANRSRVAEPPKDWERLALSAGDAVPDREQWQWAQRLMRTRRTRHSVVILVLAVLASASRLEASPAAQSNDLTVHFSPSAGTFVGSERVTIRVQARADIHFTLDGSLPTVMSPIYRGPVTLERSTRLRAVAIMRDASRSGGGSRATADALALGPVATEIYLRVNPDTQNFASRLPVILIHTFESGTLDAYGTEHLEAALQVIEPTSGTSRLVGRAALDARIGIHVRGASSRTFPKKQYAIELRGDGDDGDSARPMLGLPSHSEWVLSDPVIYDRSLIRNALAFELSNRIGRYASRTRFAEVFMVDDDGDVRAGSFLGFFTLIEKIERATERVNVSRLPASATDLPQTTGGFVVRIDKGPADFVAAGQRLQFVYPSAENMAQPERRPQLEFIRAYIDGFGQAVSAPNFRHPSTGQHYSEFIDVNAWIDHHIINTLTKNVDALRFSTYLHKDRGGRLIAGPVWDFDRSMGTPYDLRATEPEEWNATWRNAVDYFNEGWWRFLFRDPDFRSRYRARFTSLLNGTFSATNLERSVDGMVSTVGDSARRNFQRWPQSPPIENAHAAEILLLKDFLRRRVAWLSTQLDTEFFAAASALR